MSEPTVEQRIEAIRTDEYTINHFTDGVEVLIDVPIADYITDDLTAIEQELDDRQATIERMAKVVAFEADFECNYCSFSEDNGNTKCMMIIASMVSSTTSRIRENRNEKVNLCANRNYGCYCRL